MLDIVFSNKLESKFQQKLLIENYHFLFNEAATFFYDGNNYWLVPLEPHLN